MHNSFFTLTERTKSVKRLILLNFIFLDGENKTEHKNISISPKVYFFTAYLQRYQFLFIIFWKIYSKENSLMSLKEILY